VKLIQGDVQISDKPGMTRFMQATSIGTHSVFVAQTILDERAALLAVTNARLAFPAR